MNNNLTQFARQLRLSGLLLTLEMRLQEATSHQLSQEQFLELIFQDELNVRAQRQLERRKKGVSGGAKVEENWRFEIPVAAARKCVLPDERCHGLT